MSMSLFEQALKAEGVVGQLAQVARSIYKQESSSGKNTKTSNAGAVGGMQILPGTFKEVADKDWDISDPLHNARAGIRYLRGLDKLSGGDPALTAAGYYGGPGGMAKARRGIAVHDPRNPNAPSTLEYGRQVAARIKPVQDAWGGEVHRASKGSEAPAPVVADPVPVVAAAVQAQPVPVPAPIPTPAPTPMEDGWALFRNSMAQKPVQASDLDYGRVLPTQGLQVPDFMRAVQLRSSARPNFSSLEGFGGFGTGRAVR